MWSGIGWRLVPWWLSLGSGALVMWRACGHTHGPSVTPRPLSLAFGSYGGPCVRCSVGELAPYVPHCNQNWGWWRWYQAMPVRHPSHWIVVKSLPEEKVGSSNGWESKQISDLAFIGLIEGTMWCPVIGPHVNTWFVKTPSSAQSIANRVVELAYHVNLSTMCPSWKVPLVCQPVI
jgi:hypothetical protein